jgi:DNA-binding NtrC family response regulator/predicted TIM-barrel enzyme
MISRLNIKKTLLKSVASNKPVIGVAVGSGLFAKQAIKGGADLILALSAGRYRVAGVPSLGCMLPYANSNDMVFDFSTREILPAIHNIPIICGICATDLMYTHDELLKRVKNAGFSGVNNFPTTGLIDGKFGKALEEIDISFDREVEFMAKAVDFDLFTIAFVFNPEQAVKMANVGVDIICAHLGWTKGGERSIKQHPDIDEDLLATQIIFSSIDNLDNKPLKMIYGGSVSTPEDAYYFYKNTSAIGYIGGSSFERIPTEMAISETTDKFKNYYKLEHENKLLKKALKQQNNYDELIGHSQAMSDIYAIINKIADKKVNVLVQGESGTGKELIVRALHKNSRRRNESFIKVNCAAIPATLLEDELFGHEKGAFTGAERQRIGKFELAHKGTLFLDEIGEMDLALQAKLLRAIQMGEFERVGGEKTLKVDVRIICATNINLKDAIETGLFREDLYYRLNVVSITSPPLRERKEDIPLLVEHFLQDIVERFNFEEKHLTPQVYDMLIQYDWPGNVRELKHTLERAALLSEGNWIREDIMPRVFHPEEQNNKHRYTDTEKEVFQGSIGEIEKQLILKELVHNRWNRTKTAEILGMTRRTLYNKIKKYELKEER